MNYILSVIFALTFSGQLFARDPIGEKAFYKIDRNSARTSSMIQSGEMSNEVMRYLPESEAYELKNDCHIKIQFFGEYSGTSLNPLPAILFDENFIEQLRNGLVYEHPLAKVRHAGYRNVRNMDGHTYDNCDVVVLSDISSDADGFGESCAQRLIYQMAQSQAIAQGMAFDERDVEDLEITFVVKTGIPVVGGVKFDVKGKYQGMNLKAGADYIAPTSLQAK